MFIAKAVIGQMRRRARTSVLCFKFELDGLAHFHPDPLASQKRRRETQEHNGFLGRFIKVGTARSNDVYRGYMSILIDMQVKDDRSLAALAARFFWIIALQD